MKRTTFTVGMPAYTFSRMGRELSSGEMSKVIVSANRPGAGIRLSRGDVPSRSFVPVHPRHFTETRPALVIGKGSIEVAGLETLLAALYAAGAWGTDIKAFSRDVPNIDGTILPWIEGLKEAELYREGGGSDRVLELNAPLALEGLNWQCKVTPSRKPSLEVQLVHKNPGIGPQSFKLQLTQSAILKELGECRPFRLAKNLDPSLENDAVRELAKLGLVLLFEDDGAVSEGVTLRSSDEVARRCALEAIGCLTSLGAPLMADIVIKGPSLAAYREILWALSSTDQTELKYAS